MKIVFYMFSSLAIVLGLFYGSIKTAGYFYPAGRFKLSSGEKVISRYPRGKRSNFQFHYCHWAQTWMMIADCDSCKPYEKKDKGELLETFPNEFTQTSDATH